ncbi:MAG: nuclear transport factor 2 family protein [Nitrososphaeraceae archaeon]
MNIKVSMIEISNSIKKNIIMKYFRFVQIGDLDNLLELFDEDIIIYEPFSKIKKGLKGKQNITSFLKIAIFSTKDMRYDLKFESINNNLNSVLVRYKKNGEKNFKFNFKFVSLNRIVKIKSIEIIIL